MSGEHIVKSFEAELKRLVDLLVQMGGLVESQLVQATKAVVEKDSRAATQAVEQDVKVDELESAIEQHCIRMLALRQPMAADLRLIISSLKTSTDMERIGDYAANVAKRSVVLSQFNLPFSLSGIGSMARLVQGNLKLTIDAIGEANAEKAIEVWRSDQAIDDLYNTIFRELITYMMEDPRNITPCTHLLFIAKNLERMGDHCTNIAETVYFAVRGENIQDARPKSDNSAYAVVRPKES